MSKVKKQKISKVLIFKKVIAVISVIFLLYNLFAIAMGKISILFFWINLVIFGAISYWFYER